MIRFTLALDDHATQSALRSLQSALSPEGMAPPLREMGEVLIETTKRRFVDSAGPDGTPWPALADSTLLGIMRKATRGQSLKTQRGKVRAAAGRAASNRKPLVDTKDLASGIRYRVSAGVLEVGTNRSFGKGRADASVHQMGDRRGRIPARPFLGLSTADRQSVLEIVSGHLARSVMR